MGKQAREEASVSLGTRILSAQELPGAEEQIELLVPPLWIRSAAECMPTGLALHPLWPNFFDTFTLLATLNLRTQHLRDQNNTKSRNANSLASKGNYVRFIQSLGILHWNEGHGTQCAVPVREAQKRGGWLGDVKGVRRTHLRSDMNKRIG